MVTLVRSAAARRGSLGDLVTAAATNSVAADDLRIIARAFAGAGSTAAGFAERSTPLAEDVLLFSALRPLLTAFQHAELPPNRMILEWQRFATVTGDAAEQEAEGDDLAEIRVEIDEAGTYRVLTVGANARISQQIDDRSPELVNAILRAQLLAYNRRAETVVRGVLTGLTGTGTATLAAGNKAKAVGGWDDVAISAVEQIEDAAATPAAWLMSRTEFRTLAAVTKAGGTESLYVPATGAGKLGGVPIRAHVAGIPVLTDPGMVAGASYIVAADALILREESPLSQTDLDVKKLLRDLSLYGFLAVEPANPAAVVKVTHS